MQDFSFQGKTYLAARLASGKPGALRWVGDAGTLQLSMSSSEDKQTESYTGKKQTVATLSKGTEVTFTLSLKHFTKENLALGLYGEVQTIDAGTVTDEPLPADLVVDDLIRLDFPNVSDVVLNDGSATPAPLTEGTDYSVESAAGGLIKLLNVDTYTQPFTADYSYNAGVDVVMFQQKAPLRYLVMDGLNDVEGSTDTFRCMIYKMKFDPIKQLDLINDSFGSLELTGTCLFDPLNEADSTLGGFGKLQLLGDS